MPWQNIFKIFTYAFESDPQSAITKNQVSGAGISQPDVVPNIRQDGNLAYDSKQMVRIAGEFIDLTTITSRSARLKEYERLRSIPEIEQAMQVIADEACVAGDTIVETLFDGPKTIKWLAENKKEEFFVYCWDFNKQDYTIGVAHSPRLIKKEKCFKVILDNGTSFTATADHLVLLSNGAWSLVGDLTRDDCLMPFYRKSPNQNLTKLRKHQYPRIYSHTKGWIHERQFIDEWRLGKNLIKYEKCNKISRMIESGLNTKEIAKFLDRSWESIEFWLNRDGFTYKEIKNLCTKITDGKRKILAVIDAGIQDVYDLSVNEHKNFCGESIIFHNCQKNESNDVITISCDNEEVRKEIKWLFLNRNMLNLNRKASNYIKKLCINGDLFLENIIDIENPKSGILKLADLPAETMYRIESTKGKLFEFQQSAEGPDYDSLIRYPADEANEEELSQSRAIRFSPNQITHIRLGDERKTFYPYGQSLIEPARGPANQLRLMEDSMVVYRLSRAPERRVFYIDVGTQPSFKSDAFMDRVKDLLRKKKITKTGTGASAVEERYTPPSADEDIWIPIRPNSNTRVETLPGASNLGEIDDTVYFKQKLYTALNMPSSYLNSEDINATRITLSVQNVRFAKMIERIQEAFEDGLYDIASKHLILLGYPEEEWGDLKIKMTPPSEYKELSRMEIENNRINTANTLKSSMLMSDFHILTKILKYNKEEAEDIVQQIKIQKLEEAKLQIMLQNPTLMLGTGTPGDENKLNIGVTGESDSPMFGDEQSNPQDQMQTPQNDQLSQDQMQAPPQTFNKSKLQKFQDIIPIEDPKEEDIKKYNLELISYEQEKDHEEVDWTEIEN